MLERRVSATRFERQCRELLDEVTRTKVGLVITKQGKPVVRLVPVDQGMSKCTLGSVALVAPIDTEYFSTGAAWDADQRFQDR
jgi:prevent-host-death family protein